ncbi:MAG TPA: flagellar type III secretion system pore protein FliP [Syntrophomonas sp.]|nr:flagellar type III secretion system pore protein FliP [Syntrophomonas sp.]
MANKRRYTLLGITMLTAGFVLLTNLNYALADPIPGIDLQALGTNNPNQVVDTVRIFTLITILSLAPAILIMVTSFTRIVIVLSFVRNALGTQQIPPNQVLIGLALLLTFFTMAPTYQTIKTEAINPYMAGQMGQSEAMETGAGPLKDFMLRQTRDKDLNLFIDMSSQARPANREDLSLGVLVPAFIISELKTAFQMGFYIFLPFLVIDIVVSSTLMSMGMFMISPVMISLPFKILLFVLTDGWYLVVKSLLESFR